MAEEGMMRTAEIHHLSHNQHSLLFRNGELYICDGCQEYGYGHRYECSPCNFTMHKSCARAPKSACHSGHPQHPLVLREKPVSAQRVCDICGEQVLGFVYDCRGCGVDIHLSCVMLPATLRHALHPHHTLQLLLYTYDPPEDKAEAPPARICNACGKACNPGLRSYHCGTASNPCDFNLHISCAKLPVDPFEEMIMQSISPLEVPPKSSTAAAQAKSGLEAQVELMKIQNQMMIASAAYDVHRAFAFR